jgi:hypothetical protein
VTPWSRSGAPECLSTVRATISAAKCGPRSQTWSEVFVVGGRNHVSPELSESHDVIVDSFQHLDLTAPGR